MLVKISGHLVQKTPGRILLKVGPLVLEVMTPFSLAERLPAPGEEVELFVSLKMRNEQPELYGFLSLEERELFEKLQGISRLGPRLALNILGVFSPEEFSRVVAENNVERLAQVPGIGPRRAERLCVECRTRLKLKPEPKSPLFEEALSALLNLGFSYEEARGALEKVFQEGKDLSQLITEALKRLSQDGTG